MKISNLKFLVVILGASVTVAGCNGLGKMAKNANTVTYEVTPNPLEMHGDSVAVTISGQYPAKYFNKKVAVAITPTLKYSGGETSFRTVNLKGESATTAEGTVIPYANGGSFSYTDKIPYNSDMRNSTLVLQIKGSKGSKSKDFPEVQVAEGVIVTPLLVAKDNKPSVGADKFTKTVARNNTADIHFLVNQANIRPTELRQNDVKALLEYVKKGKAKNYIWNGATVSAYASPDGEERLNEGLAERRAKVTSDWLTRELKKMKIGAASNAGFVKSSSTPEDWDGFKKLMQESDMADKELILRVLNMYSDPAQREKEIKAMAATYTEIASDIMPRLRRSVITVNAEEKSRSDEAIMALVNSNPDSLSVEEILYAATLTNDNAQKLKIYQTAERQYPNDWRTTNNIGYAYVLQNNLSAAKTQFEKANQTSPNNPVIQNNLGVIAHLNNDRAAAAEYYAAASADANAQYNMGILKIQQGDYTAAVSSMGSSNSFNSALAKTLAGNYDGALTTLDASPDKNTAAGYYLKAVIGARKNDKNMVVTNLKQAVAKDASLKDMARTDMEFLKYRTDAEFTAAVN